MSKKITTLHKIYLQAILFGAMLERGFFYFIIEMIPDTLEKYYKLPEGSWGHYQKILKHLVSISSIIGSLFADLLFGKFYALYLSLSIYNIGVGNLIYSNFRMSPKSYVYSLYIISVCSGLIRANIITYGFSKLIYRSNVWFFFVSYYFYINLSIILSDILYNILLKSAGYFLTYIFLAVCLHATLIIIYSFESSFSQDISILTENIEKNEQEDPNILKPSFLQIFKLLIIVIFIGIGSHKGIYTCDKLIKNLDPVFQSTIYYKLLFRIADPLIVCTFCSFFNHKADRVLLKLFLGTVFSIVTCLFNIFCVCIKNKIFKTKSGIVFYLILLILYSFTEILIVISSYFLAYLFAPSGYESISLGIILLSQFASQFMIHLSTIITSVEIYQHLYCLLMSFLGMLLYILFFGLKSTQIRCNLNKKNPMYGK